MIRCVAGVELQPSYPHAGHLFVMKKFFKNLLVAIKRQAKVNPVQMGLAIVLSFAILTQIGLATRQNSIQNAESDRITSLPEISLRDLSDRAQEGGVDKVITHQVRSGTWLIPQTQTYMEIVDSEGKSWGIETSTALGSGEELSKMLFGAAQSHDIQFSVGQELTPLATDKIFLIVMLAAGFILFVGLAQRFTAESIGGASFRPQNPNRDQTLDDVVGYEAVKGQLREIKEGILNFNSSIESGIQPPRGILLTGGPGVGKSLMARCLANEMGADFFVASGADFAEMYVGVGPRRVRSLFKMARMSRMAVVFIDEIDALGSRDRMGNDTERLATMNQLLAEMDGTNGNGRLIVIAATNAEDRIDPALLRNGRFDLRVMIPPPDTTTRKGIIEYHLRKRPVEDNLDLDAVALRTQGYSGAELRGLVEEAARLAAREAEEGEDGKKDWKISQSDLFRAQEIARLGLDTPNAHADDRVRVAIHELGHALLGWRDNSDIVIEKVTIEGRGQALGYAWFRPIEERRLMDHEEAQARLRMMLAGRAAEEVILGTVSAGAADDLRKAQDLSTQLVVDYGIGQTSGLSRPVQLNAYGHEVLTAEGKEDAARIVRKAYEQTLRVIEEHRDWIMEKTELLVVKGTLEGEELFSGLRKQEVSMTQSQKWAKDLAQELARRAKELTGPATQASRVIGDMVPAAKADQETKDRKMG